MLAMLNVGEKQYYIIGTAADLSRELLY